jgi:hypothetical protein
MSPRLGVPALRQGSYIRSDQLHRIFAGAIAIHIWSTLEDCTDRLPYNDNVISNAWILYGARPRTWITAIGDNVERLTNDRLTTRYQTI